MAKNPAKNLTPAAVNMLGNSPEKIVDAFNALTAYGVDRAKLAKLIERRKVRGGRPDKAEQIARLIFDVNCYQRDNPGASVKDAITGVLEKFGLSREEKKRKLRSLQTAYSRATRQPKEPG